MNLLNIVLYFLKILGGWSQDNTGSDGLIWKGCLSCHSDNGAFTYAVHNSQEANAGHMLSAILQAVAGASIGSSSSSSKLNALSSEEMANIWGAGGFKAAPVELFDKAGIEYTEHFAVRISGRASRGVTPEKALDAYRNGRMYYNTETGNYIRHNSTTKISVVVDKLKDGKAITVFEGNPSPTWNIIKFKK